MVADVLAAWPRVLSSDEEAVMGVMKPDAALGPPNTGRAVDTLALVWPKWAGSRLAGRDAVCQSATVSDFLHLAGFPGPHQENRENMNIRVHLKPMRRVDLRYRNTPCVDSVRFFCK
jgi:hypothetical protein